jgi:class 3 adenylate cyclase
MLEPSPIAALTELELAHSGTSRAERRRSRTTGRSGYGPERRLVTILFADVKGSTALSRSVALEDWWLVIAELFDDMCEGVSLFDGRVDGFTGDGVMAVFEDHGGPGDHADRACAAALWVRDAMHRRADQLRRERRLELAVRIGLNSGEVLVGTIGRRESRRYTVGGYPVALAKRIEALAHPGRVWVSEDTAHLVAPARRPRDLGAFDVSGAPSRVRVFELLARGDRIRGARRGTPAVPARH